MFSILCKNIIDLVKKVSMQPVRHLDTGEGSCIQVFVQTHQRAPKQADSSHSGVMKHSRQWWCP